jgi:hypothetical protein
MKQEREKVLSEMAKSKKYIFQLVLT